MDLGKEFKKFATKEKGISSTYYNDIISSMFPSGLTPNIIEERQMNIAIFDVFSRLMMDRIIFLSQDVASKTAGTTQSSGIDSLLRATQPVLQAALPVDQQPQFGPTALSHRSQ